MFSHAAAQFYLYISYIWRYIITYLFIYALILHMQDKYFQENQNFLVKQQGPVVQSVVSLTSSLKVISLTVLADSIYNILIFVADAKATHIFSAKNFSIFAFHSM